MSEKNGGPRRCPHTVDGLTFPWRLHAVLEAAESNGFERIISWLPGDVAFKVHDAGAFEVEIIPKYLPNMTRYKSFLRQLNLYSFLRITKGEYQGSYHHPQFLRMKKSLCNEMVLTKVKGVRAARRACRDHQQGSNDSDATRRGTEIAKRTTATRISRQGRTPECGRVVDSAVPPFGKDGKQPLSSLPKHQRSRREDDDGWQDGSLIEFPLPSFRVRNGSGTFDDSLTAFPEESPCADLVHGTVRLASCRSLPDGMIGDNAPPRRRGVNRDNGKEHDMPSSAMAHNGRSSAADHGAASPPFPGGFPMMTGDGAGDTHNNSLEDTIIAEPQSSRHGQYPRRSSKPEGDQRENFLGAHHHFGELAPFSSQHGEAQPCPLPNTKNCKGRRRHTTTKKEGRDSPDDFIMDIACLFEEGNVSTQPIHATSIDHHTNNGNEFPVRGARREAEGSMPTKVASTKKMGRHDNFFCSVPFHADVSHESIPPPQVRDEDSISRIIDEKLQSLELALASSSQRSGTYSSRLSPDKDQCGACERAKEQGGQGEDDWCKRVFSVVASSGVEKGNVPGVSSSLEPGKIASSAGIPQATPTAPAPRCNEMNGPCAAASMAMGVFEPRHFAPDHCHSKLSENDRSYQFGEWSIIAQTMMLYRRGGRSG
mmetsp:Transcript_7182/g.21170  ORF Transcript_7182/g.21170 Transcript_7182/m.21170 type:complete len:652 (-) Transcript_7182:191-2146(-)